MTSALETIRYHSGIAGEEVADMVDSLEREVSSLREQVEKLTKERDELVNAIDNEMVVTHMGVFNAGDDPKVALNKIYCYAQDLGEFFAEDACKEQLAALAEQNEKLKDAIQMVLDDAEECTDHDGWTAMLLSLEAYHSADTTINGCDSDLASPVLNRIRAETLNQAAKWFNDNVDNRTDTWQAQELRRMAAELEKTNG